MIISVSSYDTWKYGAIVCYLCIYLYYFFQNLVLELCAVSHPFILSRGAIIQESTLAPHNICALCLLRSHFICLYLYENTIKSVAHSSEHQ